jgi:hypothetical protein
LMIGMDLCCQEQKTECVYRMKNWFSVSLKVKNLDFFKIGHSTAGVHCLKIEN